MFATIHTHNFFLHIILTIILYSDALKSSNSLLPLYWGLAHLHIATVPVLSLKWMRLRAHKI